MQKLKHTPGPWRSKTAHGEIHKNGVFGPPHADGGDFSPLARFASKADADLAAAAPELLAALRALAHVAIWDDETDRDEFDAASDMAQAAIAKAEGGGRVSGHTPKTLRAASNGTRQGVHKSWLRIVDKRTGGIRRGPRPLAGERPER